MWEFDAIGTHWRVQLPSLDPKSLAALKQAVAVRIEEFDMNYSRFRTDSLVHKMSENAGTYELPADAKLLFDLYEKLYEVSSGAVTPLIGQLLVDAGYDASYSLKSGELHAPPLWKDIAHYRFPSLTLNQPALLDLGAAGKGYLVDLVSEIIEQQGVDTYLVDAGGDIRVRTSSEEPCTIGLEHPEDSTQVLGVATLTNRSICGSAGNRRAWGDFHHIFNPDTKESVQDVRAVWVVADTTFVADGISTALFFVEPKLLQERLEGNYSFEYFVVYPDYSFTHSEQFPAEFFLREIRV